MPRKICLDILKNPSTNGNPRAVIDRCYKEIQFPTFRQISKIPAQMLDGQSIGFFQTLFPTQINILPHVWVRPDGLFQVPKRLQITIKDNIGESNLVSGLKTNRRARYQLIPFLIASKELVDNLDCVLVLLHDLQEDSWELFQLPGGSCEQKQEVEIERRLLQLLGTKLKLPIRMFYQSIRFRPNPGTEAALWWSSYLVYLKMKGVEKYREVRVHQALADLIENNDRYRQFVKGFQNYMISNGEV